MPAQQIQQGSDGLPVIVQGSWSKDKLHFLEYFAAMFTGGMKNRWPTRAYVDLFAGPGMCLDRTSNQEFQGSPLRALRCPTPFTHLYFNDKQDGFIGALQSRQEQLFPGAIVKYSDLDCNAAALQIRRDLPRGALTLAFIDPWAYEMTMDGIASLVEGTPVDLIVTFHTTAIKRVAHHDIAAVDRFLDDKTWRDRYWSASGDLSTPRTVVLIDTFRNRLKDRLDYRFSVIRRS